jgi:hypothetical protein
MDVRISNDDVLKPRKYILGTIEEKPLHAVSVYSKPQPFGITLQPDEQVVCVESIVEMFGSTAYRVWIMKEVEDDE